MAYDISRDPGTHDAIAALMGIDHDERATIADRAPRVITRRHELQDGRHATFVLNWTEATHRVGVAVDSELHSIEGSVPLVVGNTAEVRALSGAVLIHAG